MKAIHITLLVLFMASSVWAADIESEIVLVNKSANERTVSGKLFTRTKEILPFLIVLQANTCAYLYANLGTSVGANPGFLYLISKQNDHSDAQQSPLTRQLVITLEEKGVWNAVCGPSLNEQSTRRNSTGVRTRICFPSFSRLECEIDP